MDSLEEKLVGEIEITSGKIIILAPGDGKLFWFRDIKDEITAKNSYPNVIQYKEIVLADMLTTQYSVFRALKSGDFIMVERVPKSFTLKSNTIIAFDRILACCDNSKIPWDLRGDRAYATELPNGLYQVKFIEGNILGVFSKR